MAGRSISGLAVAEIGAGLILAWSGIENVSVAGTLRSLATGRLPAPGPAQQLVNAASSGGAAAAAGPGSGTGLAANFRTYVGVVPYVWGGANPQTGWDCSGGVNYCANLNEHLPIPGYAPNTRPVDDHGPATLMWLAWAPANMTHLTRAEVTTDDVVVWQTHMGVALDSTDYVSAADPQLGTCVQPIDTGGPFGEIPTFWRYR